MWKKIFYFKYLSCQSLYLFTHDVYPTHLSPFRLPMALQEREKIMNCRPSIPTYAFRFSTTRTTLYLLQKLQYFFKLFKIILKVFTAVMDSNHPPPPHNYAASCKIGIGTFPGRNATKAWRSLTTHLAPRIKKV